jgi:hypothetical protein
MPDQLTAIDPETQVLQVEKDSGLEWRKRRHPDWTDIYTLYRDKTIEDRVLNRQTINIPLMKYIIATILKNLDETDTLYFSNLDNKHQQEVFYNEYWKEMAKRNKLPIKDTIDKKQGALFGRSFKKLNIENGKVTFEIIDPQDMLVSRFVDPSNMHGSPCTFQTGIYRPLREILDNPDYDEKGKAELRSYFEEGTGKLEQDQTYELAQERAERMQTMGVTDTLDPVLGETYVELNEAYRYELSEVDKEEVVVWKYVLASTTHGLTRLHKKELHQIIGKTVDNFWYNHLPYSTWGADPERTDFWCDGPADIVKQINIVLNTWVSQLIENRTLRNFNMNYYDSTAKDFVPQTFVAEPWGWYPVAGDPNKVIKTVNVDSLADSLEEMQFLIGIAEKATAATAAQTGSVEQRQVTLGEVQIAVANAEERIKSMEKYINESWEDFGILYTKMLEGASQMLDTVEIHKKGRQGKKMYSKKVSPKDWLTKSGYVVEVRTKKNKQEEDLDTLQKLQVAVVDMPDNIPLLEIKKKKELELANLTTEEINDVLAFEKQKMLAPPVMPGQGVPGEMGQPTAGGGQTMTPAPAMAEVPTPEQIGANG